MFDSLAGKVLGHGEMGYCLKIKFISIQIDPHSSHIHQSSVPQNRRPKLVNSSTFLGLFNHLLILLFWSSFTILFANF